MKKPYKTLLFDLDNTLLDFTESEHRSLTSLHTLYFENHLPKTAFLNSYHDINQSLWRRVSYGQLTPTEVKTERFSRLVKKHQLAKTADTLANEYEALLCEHTDWLPGAQTAIDTLRKHYQIGIITNGLTRVQKEKCQYSGISDWCDCVIISEEIGIAKPNPAIFQHAFDQLDTHANACLMFGDSLHSDHQGAINTGMDFCWITYRLANKKETPKQKPTFEAEHIADIVNELI